jgi:hypothetical protein
MPTLTPSMMKRTHSPLLLLACLLTAGFSTEVNSAGASSCACVVPTSNSFGVTYDNLRGTNYVFNSSHLIQDGFGLLTFPGDGPPTTRIGTYSRKNVESELAVVAAAGFNNVRVTPSFFGWVIDNAQFETNLRHFVGVCQNNRLTITWVLWTAIGNGPSWQTLDVADFLGNDPKVTTNDGLHAALMYATLQFQALHRLWAPAHRLGYATGYPAPGNKLLRNGGDPTRWTKGAMNQRVDRFIDVLLRILTSTAGRATLFQIDLGNELDTVGIPLANAIAFLSWNYRKIKLVLPNAKFSVGWAEVSITKYASYVAALEKAGIQLSRHSFHFFATHPDEYKKQIEPFVNWARSRKKPLALMVSEFYRVDTPEWHHLHDTFEFFSDREIPTIMWGFLSSNLFTDPKTRGPGKGIYVDGVVDATNVSGVQGFHKVLKFAPRSAVDLEAVLAYNNVGGRESWRVTKR